VKCTACSYKEINNDSPIVPALDRKGLPDANQTPAMIPIKDLPACPECGGLIRPDIVWFGENLDHGAIEKASNKAEEADLVLIVGTTSVVYPGASLLVNKI
jgi:NAD-dependent deacetylase sirtuin 5